MFLFWETRLISHIKDLFYRWTQPFILDAAILFLVLLVLRRPKTDIQLF